MEETPTLGAIHSEPDYRDGLVASAVTAAFDLAALPFTKQTDLTKLGPVMMQGHQPACVSFAWVMVMKMYWFLKTGHVIDFEPAFLHILSKTPELGPDDGRVPRTVAKISVQYGCCTKATMNLDVNMSTTAYCNKDQISAAAYQEALQYRLPGYVRLPLTKNSIRTFINLYGVISALFVIGSEFWLPSWDDKDIDPLRTPKNPTGGHQWVLKGWVNDTLETMRNHWSDAWANKGEANYSFVNWSPFMYEAWAPAEIPADVAQLLSSLPSQANFHYQWNYDMSQGTASEDIKFAQIAFMILGYLPPIKPEEIGIFGPKTAQANLKYQQSKKISPTFPSSIGPKTRSALNADFPL